MRKAPSISQLAQLSSLPCGERTGRGPKGASGVIMGSWVKVGAAL